MTDYSFDIILKRSKERFFVSSLKPAFCKICIGSEIKAVAERNVLRSSNRKDASFDYRIDYCKL